MRKAELFYVAAVFAFVLLLPLFFFLDARRLTPLDRRTAGVLLLNCACSLNQYTGLSVLDAMSSPLSHSLANVMKRAAVITVAMLLAQKPVTLLHLFGVGLSVFGAFVYQQLAAWRRSASYERLPLIGEGSPQPSFEAGAAAPAAVTPLPPAVNGGGRHWRRHRDRAHFRDAEHRHRRDCTRREARRPRFPARGWRAGDARIARAYRL